MSTLLAGKDMLALAGPSRGKSTAIVLALLHALDARQARAEPKEPIALVLAGSRESAEQNGLLCDDVGRYLRLRQTVAADGAPWNHPLKDLRAGVEILVASPRRLLELLRQRAVSLRGLEVAIVDDADQLLDTGSQLELDKLLAELPVKRQTAVFAAVDSPSLRELAKDWLRTPHVLDARDEDSVRGTTAKEGGRTEPAMPAPRGKPPAPSGKTAKASGQVSAKGSGKSAAPRRNERLDTPAASGPAASAPPASDSAAPPPQDLPVELPSWLERPPARMPGRVTLPVEEVGDRPEPPAPTPAFAVPGEYVLPVGRRDKIELLLHLLQKPGVTTAVVFVRDKRNANRIAGALKEARFAAVTLHSDTTLPTRERALLAFAENTARVLVATDTAARVLPLPPASLVVHFEPPRKAADFAHRARTSPAAFVLCAPEERRYLRTIEHVLGYGLPVVERHPFAGGRARATAKGARTVPKSATPKTGTAKTTTASRTRKTTAAKPRKPTKAPGSKPGKKPPRK